MSDAATRVLADLGWKPVFARQVTSGEARDGLPVRVLSVHRGRVTVAGADGEESIPSRMPAAGTADDRPTVGDWLMIDRTTRGVIRILDRTSLFKRPAPGDDRRVQLIAANVDTLFIVTSCNADFNVARVERYLVLAREVGVRPVVVLTKTDLAADPADFAASARALQSGLRVHQVDARDATRTASLADYCGRGETVALVGSSGVGKSTLVNTLRGSDGIATQAVREDDGKGRHTTTVREMHRLTGRMGEGGWLVDTPGMRELQMSEVAAGVAEVFDDVTDVALACRFSNCGHGDEPGCAIQAAIGAGTLDPDRFDRWRKLAREDVENSGAAAVRRARPAKGHRR
ncbi:ribosome small subunit-dependent GTPase A [Sphingomonas sp. A2-49]|uniref:ribosome small subunit-dependent GTPase A n=1 Tax=Sphingomonas sp. A2-49 TaxID=1391375 RepID=UPI0021CE5E59|nr:ribosome small subunit-dependent GTPase A [Sphingomonas sp. A2-49]MCU6454378.1 ribosome small subunit-dependent GTPase A [Sphingomonas sp. A2-49]